jgi:hypothetical protein
MWAMGGFRQTKGKDTTKYFSKFALPTNAQYSSLTFDQAYRYTIHDSLKGEVAYKLSDTSKWVVLDTQATINTLIKLLNFRHQYSQSK